MPLMGRSAILGEQRNNDFVDVACGRGEMADSTYAITKTGLLCEFNNRRLLDKWVELRVSRIIPWVLGVGVFCSARSRAHDEKLVNSSNIECNRSNFISEE